MGSSGNTPSVCPEVGLDGRKVKVGGMGNSDGIGVSTNIRKASQLPNIAGSKHPLYLLLELCILLGQLIFLIKLALTPLPRDAQKKFGLGMKLGHPITFLSPLDKRVNWTWESCLPSLAFTFTNRFLVAWNSLISAHSCRRASSATESSSRWRVTYSLTLSVITIARPR